MQHPFLTGVFFTLAVLLVALWLIPIFGAALKRAVWRLRDTFDFSWVIFDSYLRYKGWRSGPILKVVTRQARRRIQRKIAKNLL